MKGSKAFELVPHEQIEIIGTMEEDTNKRPTVGDLVRRKSNNTVVQIERDDRDSQPYKVTEWPGQTSGWLYPSDVVPLGAVDAPAEPPEISTRPIEAVSSIHIASLDCDTMTLVRSEWFVMNVDFLWSIAYK